MLRRPSRPRALALLHQKGGTGKSTLAIAAAIALSAAGRRVLLLDADYQGTSSEWGNRYGLVYGVETRSQVQPIVHQELERFAGACDVVVIDGPPALSEMTESIVRAAETVLIPVRPAWPDVWALPWLAAIVRKLQGAGTPVQARVVFTHYAGEALAPLQAEVARWELPLHEEPLPADPAFAALFAGEALPPALAEAVQRLLAAVLEEGGEQGH